MNDLLAVASIVAHLALLTTIFSKGWDRIAPWLAFTMTLCLLEQPVITYSRHYLTPVQDWYTFWALDFLNTALYFITAWYCRAGCLHSIRFTMNLYAGAKMICFMLFAFGQWRAAVALRSEMRPWNFLLLILWTGLLARYDVSEVKFAHEVKRWNRKR